MIQHTPYIRVTMHGQTSSMTRPEATKLLQRLVRSGSKTRVKIEMKPAGGQKW